MKEHERLARSSLILTIGDRVLLRDLDTTKVWVACSRCHRIQFGPYIRVADANEAAKWTPNAVNRCHDRCETT